MGGDTVEGCRTGNMVMSDGRAVSTIKALLISTQLFGQNPLQPHSYCVCPKWLRVLQSL